MPDFIRRNIRGSTDSEHFFHMLLSFLHDSGQLDRPQTDDKAVLSALRSAVRLIDQLSKEVGAPPATLNLLLTNGLSMYGLSRGSPMMVVERQSIHDPADTAGDVEELPGRYVMLVSNGASVPRDFRPVEEGQVCIITRDLGISIQPL
jgi:glutamine amidotransferase